MKFVWMAWNGGGSVPPQLAVCEALVASGHDVVAVVDPEVRDQIERVGIPTEPCAAPQRPSGRSVQELMEWVCEARLLGDSYAADMRAAIDAHHPDRLLVDGRLYSAQVEAHASGIRYAVLWHTLVDTAETGPVVALLDNGPNLAAHNSHRLTAGLPKVASVQDTLLDADWFVALSHAALDSPRNRHWPNLHYVGAPMPETKHVDIDFPDGNGPLVLVGFSTTPMGQVPVLQRVLDGLATLDVRVVLTLGSAREDELDLPRNAVAVRYVAHDQLLPEISLVVSHVGHGTMCAAARHAVPILAMPMGRDQDRNAEILVNHGIGRSLQPTAPPEDIAAAASALLEDQDVRQASTAMATAIAQSPNLDAAVQLITAT